MIASSFCLAEDHWLSNILGRIAFNIQPYNGNLNTEILCRKLSERASFGSIKLPADQIELSVALQNIGFRHVDTALTFTTGKKHSGHSNHVRWARPDDKLRVVEIAGQAFSTSRFHLDPYIQNMKADTIKSQWAENFFYGRRGDAMIVAEDANQKVQGFCQLLFMPDSTVIIDLIGFMPDATGMGMGSQMISFLWQEGIKQYKIEKIIVGTQAVNTKAVKFYENLGFRLIKAQNILHFSN